MIKKRLQLTHPINNESGAAALMGIVMGLVIMGTIAFNFLAESRLKQSGAILTYTSTNAFMIAEAGLRYTQKCLTETHATCSTDFPDSQTSTAWSTDLTGADNFNNDFGGGNFAISFPGHASNDANNILVVSTGTYKGAQRSIQRFIPRFGQCPFIDVDQPATSCSNGGGPGTQDLNNASIDPPLPDPPQQVECPTSGGDVDLVPALPTLPAACVGCPNAACPNFNVGSHLDGSNFLIPRANNYFCNMDIDNATVMKTTVSDLSGNNDDVILVANDFTIQDLATVKLNDDAPSIDSATFTANTGADKLISSGNPFANGNIVVLGSNGTLPAPFSAGTPYAVVNRSGADFQLSTTVGGAAIDITDSGSPGTAKHTAIEMAGFTVNAAQNKLLVPGHSYSANQQISLISSGALPTGLSSGLTYYVVNPTAGVDLQLSFTSGGAAVSISDNGTGLHAINNGEQSTVITVYGNALIQELGEIRVKGVLFLKGGDKFTMKSSSKVNSITGNVANMIAMIENDVLLTNSSLYKGAIISDGQIQLQNNAEVDGALFSSDIKLQNNATLIYETSPSGDGPGETVIENQSSSVCTLGLPPAWSE